jgi:hypothetical protein
MAIHSRWRLRAGQAGVRFPAAKSVGASDNEAMAMTEQEWLACDDPRPMLDLVWKASDRKLRLFAVACCRRLSLRALLRDKLSHEAITACERIADGVGELGDRAKARAAATAALESEVSIAYEGRHYWAAVAASSALDDYEAAAIAVCRAVANDEAEYDRDASAGWANERGAQASLIHDVFGNPFRPVTLNSAWRTANVTALAQSIYADRAFDRLPILADALEDAGCDNADILNHCRQPGVHVRGCWAVDLILGKE